MRTGLLRGEGATQTCPACQGQHRSVGRIEGLPILPCPTYHAGEFKAWVNPASKGGALVAFIVGPQPEPKPKPEPVKKSA